MLLADTPLVLRASPLASDTLVGAAAAVRYAATTGTGDVAGYPGDEATKRCGG